MNLDQLSKRYFGATALNYDSKRRQSRIWHNENEAVRSFLEELPRGSSILDVPVGTGRFVELYRNLGLSAHGVDISKDMLGEAKKKAQDCKFDMRLTTGSILNLEESDGTYDAALCVRLLNWVDIEKVSAALTELQRVSKRWVIVGLRSLAPHLDPRAKSSSPVMRGMGALTAPLRKRWTIKGLVLHSPSDVADLFARLHLDVTRAVCVDTNINGTNYYLYLLEKK